MILQLELSHTNTSMESEQKENFLSEHFKFLGNFFIKEAPRKHKDFNDRDAMLQFYSKLGLSCRSYSLKHKAAQFINYFHKSKYF